MHTLHKLRVRSAEFEHICLPHSVSLQDEDDESTIIVNARDKITAYISYRESRLRLLLKAIEADEGRPKTMQDLYDAIYGDRGFCSELTAIGQSNLTCQLEYLKLKDHIREVDGMIELRR